MSVLRQILEKIQQEFSGQKAFHHVAEVCQHHRIQASPGFRAAAVYCLDSLQEAGLEAEIISFPADPQVKYWTQEMFEEWHCNEAWLDLILPRQQRLADFDANPISLIQRSIATPPEGVEADIVWLKSGDDPAPYAELDLSGKLVFTNGDINRVRAWAVEERGAIGIITDRLAEFLPVRHRYDIPDAVQYTSFWWTGDEKRCFGFVLSPKAGDALRTLCARMEQEHQQDPSRPRYPRARAKVDAQLYVGSVEDVTALIKGDTDEEIIIAAHLCHPQASANDNASGVGTALEAARALNHLINSGQLPRPRRSIRILLIPEMTGTYCYLASHESRLPQLKAAINLDMVGEKQELCQGPLVAEYPPQAARSFVGDLLAAILDAVAAEVHNLAQTSSYALFKHTVSPYSGGSDHSIFSDPSVGIPCPMLIQWPDKYYHTSEDTLDKVDPAMLYRVGCITATYAYFLANFSLKDAAWMLSQCRDRYLGSLLRNLSASLVQAASLSEAEQQEHLQKLKSQIQFALEQKLAEEEDIRRFLTPEEGEQFADSLAQEQDALRTITEMLWQRHLQQLQIDAVEEQPRLTVDAELRRIPVRLVRGPIRARGLLEKLPAAERQEYQGYIQNNRGALRAASYLVYWADGKRTISEIDQAVYHETGVSDPQFALIYFQMLQRLGLIDWA